MVIEQLLEKYEIDINESNEIQLIDDINKKAWAISRINTLDAQELAIQAKIFSEEKDYSKGLADAMITQAQCQWLQGAYSSAVNLLEKCLKLYVRLKDKLGESEVLSLFGGVYSKIGDYNKATSYFSKALKTRYELDNKEAIARSLNSLGDSYMKLKQYDKALATFNDAINIEHNDTMYKGIITYNFAEANFWLKNYEESLTHIDTCKVIATELNFPLMTVYSSTLEAKIMVLRGNLDQAEQLLIVSLRIAEEINNEERAYHLHLELGKLKEAKKDFEVALHHYKEYQNIKDKVLNVQTTERLKSVEHRREIEDAINKVDSMRGENLKLQQAYGEIESIKQKLEIQNAEIIDSIKYAKRIQEAILPSDDYVNSLFKDYFIFYQPKEELSGDFYWVSKATTSNEENFLMASVADCTGHGVPGALMSIIGNNFLRICEREESVNSPGDALDFINRGISRTLRQEYNNSNVKDGMDMTFIAIDYSINTLYFAGAKSSIFIVSKGKLVEHKGSKQPIGAFVGDEMQPFTTVSIPFKKGDKVYLSSDGYFDQFGGERGKKFMKKQFKSLLLESSELSMADQSSHLNKKFNDWKGSLEQLDDVCVFGILL